VLDVLRAFQDDGHTIVLIVGDFTAQIGDPSGRSETRPMLTREQVEANARTYFDQVGRVLDRENLEVHGNSEWLAEMDMGDVLRLLGKATLQQVLQREDFAKRMEEGSAIGAHEILYPFNQGYDSVAIDADLEIGGTDQLFNLLFGRELQKAYGKPGQDVAVFPLLVGPDGRRMSKSLGNYIGISEPPAEIYGKAMSIPDGLTPDYLRLACNLAAAEAQPILALAPRDAKAAMARRLVERLHGADAAAAAEAEFDRRFRKHELPTDVPEVAGSTLMEVLKAMGLSSAMIRDAFAHGGVKVDGEVASGDQTVAAGVVVQFGKRRVVRVAGG
jgi:tyrosyl-tRNA synthetase